MIKDVKTYFQTVASRISHAFRLESFTTEDELEFWAVSAEHLSQSGTPTFVEITQWVDRLYHAPVHFIYKMAKEDKLILLKRHIVSENIAVEVEEEENLSPKQRSEIALKLEEQLQNLQHKISFDEDFRSMGISKFSIGDCEHIPLYKDDEFWGIYCLGPYVRSPESIVPKISIISRILTRWLVALEDSNKENQLEQNTTIVEKIEGFGSGELNINEVSGFLVKHLVEVSGSDYGALMAWHGGKTEMMAHYSGSDQPEQLNTEILSDKLLIKNEGQRISFTDQASEILDQYGLVNHSMLPVTDHVVYFLATSDSNPGDDPNVAVDLQYIIDTQKALLDYQDQNDKVSEQLVDTYYKMLRNFEKKRGKTVWHTPKMIALADKFSELFGLDQTEKSNLLMTAKLHDIGYVGSLHINNKLTVGAEIEHPLIGEMMMRQLPVPKEVKDGIRTHHEWVNGSGSPKQLKEEEISWTGKIISVFEFVVEFIENHQSDTSKTDEEWMDQLIEELVNRADKQFDMVLIPTFVELLNSLGWKECCELGME